jgi:DNA polymerase-1
VLINKNNFKDILNTLGENPRLSIDIESTGLRHFHGDQLFSIIIADDTKEYYFDFNGTLSRDLIPKFQNLFDRAILWFGHNFKFDLHFLANEGLTLHGPAHDTMSTMRLIHSEMLSYSLDSCVKYALKRAKDDKVMAYIREHKLWTKEKIPGRDKEDKRLHFDRVPLEVIQPYAELDARLTYDLGVWQLNRLGAMESLGSKTWPKIGKLYRNERSLTKTLLGMEREGVLIDRPYCEKALVHFYDQMSLAAKEFYSLTGKEFIDSGKLFSGVFPKEQLVMNDPTATGKINPSFDSEVLQGWDDPISKTILMHRDAKKQKEFFESFLYFADKNGVLRTSFRQGGTATGRMSCTDPNMQQLSKDDDLTPQFLVRRAIIPRPGFVFVMFDYSAMEMVLLYDLAEAHSMISRVKGGLDVHQAMADQAKITRKQAKAGNFANIYGSGLTKFAQTLGCTEPQAKAIREVIFMAAPEIKPFIQRMTKEVEERGFSINWAGRRCTFLDRRFSYKATNYVIQGGGADVIKIAMVKIDRLLEGKKSKLLLSIHDECVCEIHKDELNLIPEIKHTMEISYPAKHLPLTVSIEHSYLSFADRIKGCP